MIRRLYQNRRAFWRDMLGILLILAFLAIWLRGLPTLLHWLFFQ